MVTVALVYWEQIKRCYSSCSGGNIYRVIALFADSSVIAPEFIYKWYCVTKLRSFAAPSHSKLCSPFTQQIIVLFHS